MSDKHNPHEHIDRAIEESLHETPDSIGVIAERTGSNKMTVKRRFEYLGYWFDPKAKRWVWRSSKEGKQ